MHKLAIKIKYSKQIIYSNQKFEDQIWYNQQIMIFLNFSQLPESVFRPNFSRKTFSWKPSQIFLWLESVFRWPTFLMGFRKTNTAKRKNIFLKIKSNFFLTGKCFLLTGKCFSLINFSNNKQTQKSLKSDLLESEFWETNMAFITIYQRFWKWLSE